MLRAVYARVEVRGEQFILADFTSDAKELGLTVALPETFAMARPAGIEHATRCFPTAENSAYFGRRVTLTPQRIGLLGPKLCAV